MKNLDKQLTNFLGTNKMIKISMLLFGLLSYSMVFSQAPLYTTHLSAGLPGTYTMNISNYGRKIDVQNNEIYVVLTGTAGTYVRKSDDRGQTWSAPLSVSAGSDGRGNIHVAQNGYVYVTYVNSGITYFSRSIDSGATFSAPIVVATTSLVHLNSYQNHVYVTNTGTGTIYMNNNYGTGGFNAVAPGASYVYGNLLVNKNTGELIAIGDTPSIGIRKSSDQGANWVPLIESPAAVIYYSSYTLSLGPLGYFAFVGGNANNGYRIDMNTGVTNPISLGNNTTSTGRTLHADQFGNLIDGYKNGPDVFVRYSYDQGATWEGTINIAAADRHNIIINDSNNDLIAIYESGGEIYTKTYENILSSGTIWTGNNSSDWSDGLNWSTGLVPNSTESLVIPASPTGLNFPISTADITVGNLTIESGATLGIGAGFGLTISANGEVINNGTLTLEADNSGTAWLDDFTNTGANYSGDITVQQYVLTGAANGQRMFGSPVEDGVVSGLSQTYASASTGQIVMSNCPSMSVDVGSPYNNLFEWHEDAVSTNSCAFEAWFAITDATTLEEGRGYSGWMNQGSVISFTGEPNSGDITYGGSLGNSSTGAGLPNKDGWHVLSNPYPSSIDANSITSAGWTSPQTLIAGSAFGGTFQTIMGEELGVAQGFVAKVSTATDVTFTNSMRVQGSNSFKSNTDWYDAKLDIEVSNGTNKDITYIYFNDHASAAFDAQWDCEKRISFAGIPTLYTASTNLKTGLNGNAMAELGDYSIPMGLRPESTGVFTFEARGFNTFPASTIIYLEDKATGTWTNLREQATYSFNMTEIENEDRFEIHFTKPIALNHEAESCDGNDGTITIDFGNQSIANNLQTWNYELRVNSQVISSGNEADMLELIDLEPGDYEILFTNGGLQVSEWITIEDKVAVEAEFIANATTLFTGEEWSATNTSLGATDYTWELNGESFNSTNLSYTFTTPGTYNVRLFASNNDCDAVFETTVIVNEKTTGIAEQIELNNALIFANGKTITIDLSKVALDGKTDLEIYNMVGQLMLQKLNVSTFEYVEMNRVTSGIYIVRIINQKESISKKVILK